MTKPLRIGIIGASADRGWVKESHVPAVQKLAGVELAAVATSRQSTADAAAKAFGGPPMATQQFTWRGSLTPCSRRHRQELGANRPDIARQSTHIAPTVISRLTFLLYRLYSS